MRRIEKLVKTFMEKCYENDFELFLNPEVEALKDLSKLEKDWIFFQARNGELFKLRNDYTASIVEYFNKLQLERFRVWYTG
ncbi:MAG: hypothetical protein N2250_09225, partial [Pseudothermotoga sp.]|nr:hypothetical protein [Pseudothermotoga sp.]